MFNDSGSLLFEEIIAFHDKVNYVVVFIGIFIFFTLFGVWNGTSFSLYFIENRFLEVIWTLIPAFILLCLSVPSLSLLYHIDSPRSYKFNTRKLIKVIGHQWYWSYEYNYKNLRFSYDSFMVPYTDLNKGSYRLLETDKPLAIPVNCGVLVNGITEDVIHSWCCPALGIKFDVVPGRLNRFNFLPLVSGTFYGQCSEICGANHRFMPIEIEVISK